MRVGERYIKEGLKKSRWENCSVLHRLDRFQPVGPMELEPEQPGFGQGSTGRTGGAPVGPVRLKPKSRSSAKGSTGWTGGAPVGPVRPKPKS
jgi:hypothetical protein